MDNIESEIVIEEFPIDYFNTIEFDLPGKEFVIRYNLSIDKWFVVPLYDATCESRVIPDDNDWEFIELFKGYTLTKEKFNKMKEIACKNRKYQMLADQTINVGTT